MANLGSHQLLNRVLGGRPYGTGADGVLTINSNTTSDTPISCSGSSGSTALTLASAGFANGDVIYIWQPCGTGVGLTEVQRIVSGGGTTSLTLGKALQNTYTDSGTSGNNQAIVVKVMMHSTITVSSGYTWSVPTWDGNAGGLFVVACSGVFTLTGDISGSQKGFRNGAGISSGGGTGLRGDGDAGDGGDANRNANGSGGGGGQGGGVGMGPGGGGGGNGAAGSDAGSFSGGNGGFGGTASGSADLVTLSMGGGGASGGTGNSGGTGSGPGGKGAAAIIIFANRFVNNGGFIYNNGQNGQEGGGSGADKNGGGGGGAGGSTLGIFGSATLGTSKFVNVGGNGGAGGSNGGAGAVGRIAIHYGLGYTGESNPALTAVRDPRLVLPSGGFGML